MLRDPSGSISLHHLNKLFSPEATTLAGRAVIQDGRQVLAECNLFRGIAADERATLIAHAQIRKYAADDTIFLMGSTGDSVMVVLSGHVHISVASSDGKEIMLAVHAAGEIFGDMLDGKGRSADARAASECRLAVLERRDVLSFLDRHPNLWPGFVETLCGRLRRADEQMAEMALMSLPARLAKALLRMTAIEPPPKTGKHLCHVRLSQREVGSLVGATRESVNKWLRRWQCKGILRIEKSLITIVNRRALEELAQNESRHAACCDRLLPPMKAGSTDPTHAGPPIETRIEQQLGKTNANLRWSHHEAAP